MKRMILRLGLLAGLVFVSEAGFSAEPPNDELLRLQKDLLQLKRLQQEGQQFNTPSFRLLWAREAYRCGNAEGAIQEWKALAKDGIASARYILSLFDGWRSLSDDKSEGAIYALRLFRPGDGTNDACRIGQPTNR